MDNKKQGAWIYFPLANKKYSHHWLQENPEYLQKLLREHYNSDNRPVCNCSKRHEPAFSIRELKGSFYLSRMPNTSHQHGYNCMYHSLPSDMSVRNAYTEKAIKFVDGIPHVSLHSSLSRKPDDHTSTKSMVPSQQPRDTVRQDKVTLLGFLLLLWEETMMNKYIDSNKKFKHWSNVQYFISAKACEVKLGRRTLSACLYIPPQYSERNKDRCNQALSTFKKALAHKADLIPKQIVIGMVKSISENTLRIKHCAVGFNIRDEQCALFHKRFGALSNEPGQEMIVIMTVEKDVALDVYHVVEISAMHVNDKFIPFDSSYEREVLNKLITEDRNFIKPLRHQKDKSKFHPDFVLLDTEPNTIMEVFGMMDNEEYAEHAMAKIAFYKDSDFQTWMWDTSMTKSIPAFKEK